MTVSSQTLSIQGRRARVWTGGAGPALLLMHGGLGDAQQHWGRAWDALAERHFVIAPDLPAMGESEPLERVTWEQMFTWLDGLLEALRVGQVDVVGNSFGAALARLYAANRAMRVRRVVLVNGGMVPRLPAFVRALMRSSLVWKPMDWLSRKGLYSKLGLSMMVTTKDVLTEAFIANARAHAAGFSILMNTLFVGDPPAAQGPRDAVVVWGSADRGARVSVGEKVASELRAKLELVDGVGHMPQVEAPGAFVEVVERALA